MSVFQKNNEARQSDSPKEGPKKLLEVPEEKTPGPGIEVVKNQTRREKLEEKISDTMKTLKRLSQKITRTVQEMSTITSALDAVDSEWKSINVTETDPDSSFSRPSGTKVSENVLALKKKHDELGDTFGPDQDELTAKEKELEGLKAKLELESILEKREAELLKEASDLKEKMIKQDEDENFMWLSGNLEDYLVIQAELNAIDAGTWEKKTTTEWLPKDAEVPAFLPNFKKKWVNNLTGRFEPNPKQTARNRESARATEAARQRNIADGRDPDAY